MAVTIRKIKKHLIASGCIGDKSGNSFVMKRTGKPDIRVVIRPRVFRIEKSTIGKDGYYKFKRIASGWYRKVKIQDGKFINLDK